MDNQIPEKSERKLKGKPLSLRDRLIQGVLAEGKELGDPDDPAIKDWPELWRWITDGDAGRNYVKTPAKLIIQAGAGGIIATLHDADLGVSIDCQVRHLAEVFADIEKALTTGDCVPKNSNRKIGNLRKRKSSN